MSGTRGTAPRRLDEPWPLNSRELPAPTRLANGVRLMAGAIYDVHTGFRSLRLDLYLPPESDMPAPAVVWIHGGAYMHGDRTILPPVLARADMFTRMPLAGYAVASIDYRLSGEATFPAQLEDVRSAIRWLKGRHVGLGIDPDRLAIWGESAGGHLAALAGVTGVTDPVPGAVEPGDQAPSVAAVIDWYGPTDFSAMDRQAPDDSLIEHGAPDSPESRLIGAPIRDRPDLVAQTDPVGLATESAPPFLIMHGTRDRHVPFAQSEMLAARLEELGVPVTMRAIDAGHLFEGFDDDEALLAEVLAFLDRALRPQA